MATGQAIITLVLGRTIDKLATATLYDAWMLSDTYSAFHELMQEPAWGAPPVPAFDDPSGDVGWPDNDCCEHGPCACFFVTEMD